MFEFARSLRTLSRLLPSGVVGLVPVSILTFCLLGPLTSRPVTSCDRPTSSSVYRQSLPNTCHGICVTVSPSRCRGVSAARKHRQKLLLGLDDTVLGTRGSLKSDAHGSTLSLGLLFRTRTEDTSQRVCLTAVLIFHWALRVYESIQLSHCGSDCFPHHPLKKSDYIPAGGSI